MASGDEKAASQAGHMAAPTSNANAQLTLAKGEPSTQGAKRNERSWPLPDRQLSGAENVEADVHLRSSTVGRPSSWDLTLHGNQSGCAVHNQERHS
jgi:hypothetical protein